ncbi:MAG: hypothetical protein ABF330_07805 [Lentimonas sp.]
MRRFPSISTCRSAGRFVGFADAIRSLHSIMIAGMIIWTDRGFAVTDRGRLFVRNLAMCFDAYLEPAAEARYSKTV